MILKTIHPLFKKKSIGLGTRFKQKMIKTYTRITSVILALMLFVVAGCNEGGGTVTPVETVSYIATAEAPITHVNYTGPININYSQDLGSSGKDVYFIYTNISNNFTSSSANISSNTKEDLVSLPVNSSSYSESETLVEYAKAHGIGLRGTPEIAEFNANPPKFPTYATYPTASSQKMSLLSQEPLFATLGDSTSFVESISSANVPSTLREQVTVNGVTLNIWVADNAWVDTTDDTDNSCPKTKCMKPAYVTAYRDAFLKADPSNDIYDWTTNIFGSPWGSHSDLNLIDASADSQIDILFYDISNDDSVTGGTLAYFHATNNYTKSAISTSNEKLLIFMDSVLSAHDGDDGTWASSDEWPSDMISTMAHEFQHMINFYQKFVVTNSSNSASEQWLDEMSSLVTEDLLSNKMLTNGPRGVTYSNGLAGSAANHNGRLPLFNYYYDEIGVIKTSNYALLNYSIDYSFGAYLARNFGGVDLFQKIVQISNRDYRAVENALTSLGHSESFETLLQKWGVAVLFSDSTSMSQGYSYNTVDNSGFFDSTINGEPYNLGSINFFNYYQHHFIGSTLYSTGNQGPYIYSSSNANLLAGHYGMTNTFVLVGSNQTGTLSRLVYLPENMKLTVVLK